MIGRRAFAVMAGLLLLAPAQASAEADGPDFFRVTGVAADDMLNLRAGPEADAPRLAAIPAGTDGLRNLGCVGGLSLAEWSAASEAERAAAASTRWCRIGWKGLEGWVAGRFLGEGSAPAEADILSAWRPVPADPESRAELVFLRGGRVSGSTGCNRFNGSARVEDGRLVMPDPFAMTMMACPPDLQAAEDRFLALLRARPAIVFDPVADLLTLSAGELSLSFGR